MVKNKQALAWYYVFQLTVFRILFYLFLIFGVFKYGLLGLGVFARQHGHDLIILLITPIIILVGAGILISCPIIFIKHLIQSFKLILKGVPENFEFGIFNFSYEKKRVRVSRNNPFYQEYQNFKNQQQDRDAYNYRNQRQYQQSGYQCKEDLIPKTFAEACVVLDVPENLTKAEYKQAYRKKALEYHSDQFQGAGEKIRKLAEEEMKRINAAWDIINKEMPG